MIRALALALTVLTGFSGLVYEVTWQKGLAILLGSHSEATAAVLAIFLGGLSLGYSIFGHVSSRITERGGLRGSGRRLLLLYGFVEAGIGLWALAWPRLFDAARALSIALPLQVEAASFGFDLLLTVFLIGPPAVLMGGTIPILTQALARDLEDATRFHALVYGFNTLGAFAGALAGGFFLVPWMGIPGALAAMGVVNLAAGASFLALFWTGRDAVARPDPASEAEAPASFALFAIVALLLGFAMMTVQTVLIRVGGLAFGASHFTFTMVVATFVLCIAAGSLAVSIWERIADWVVFACPLALAALLSLLYPAIEDAPYAAHVLRSLFRSIDQAFYPYYLASALGILVVLALPVGLSGASLPLLFHALRREMGDLGGLAGRLYAWNTVGNLLGALLGGYVLLFWIDLHEIYRIAIASVWIAGGLLLVGLGGFSRVGTATTVALLIAAIALLPPWDPRHLTAGLFRQREALPATFSGSEALMASAPPFEILFYDDDPTSTVSVIEYPTGGRMNRSILTNGKNDGSLIHDYRTMALAGLIPCLLAERCRRGFVIGLGTGVTAGELAALESMERVLVAEISPGVIEAGPLFDTGNLGVSQDPSIEIVRGDAYRALLHSDERWDVIASEPSNPWVVGVEMLFSREFLEAARDRLAPGGVYAQWMHTYDMDDETFDLVLRTYASVFDRVAVWFTQGADLLLIGLGEGSPVPGLDRIADRFRRGDFERGLRRSRIDSLDELLAHELVPFGLITRESLPGEVHTLLHPRLSHQAALAFFKGGRASLPHLRAPKSDGEAPRGLLAELREREGGADEEGRARVVRHVCEARLRECAVLLAHWSHETPDSRLREEILEQLRRRRAEAEHFEPRTLAILTSFFAAGPGRLQPAGIREATELFFDYYHPAEPFRAEALRGTWRGCADPECISLAQQAERRLKRPPRLLPRSSRTGMRSAVRDR